MKHKNHKSESKNSKGTKRKFAKTAFKGHKPK